MTHKIVKPQQPVASQEWHHGPSWLWLLSFVVFIGGDMILGRWLLLPLYVAAFFGGMIVIDLLTYPQLERWRAWLRPRGLRTWYAIEVGLLWVSSGILLALLSPYWLSWNWHGPMWLQLVGGLVLTVSVVIGVWAAGCMGWARLLLAPAMFPSGPAAEANQVPQRLVVVGPYRYVRNPLYITDVSVILGAALLTQNVGLLLLLAAYLLQLGPHLRREERELQSRFGAPYQRYCQLVPRFWPRLKPVAPDDIYRQETP